MSDGVPLHNVHVAVQIGKQPVGLERGDADGALGDRRAHRRRDGVVDCAGRLPTARRASGPSTSRGERVCSGDSFAMFRRAKLMIGDIIPVMLAAEQYDDGTLVASLSLTDERGGPRRARVKPPAISWRPD